MDQEVRLIVAARSLATSSDDLCIAEANLNLARDRYRSALRGMKDAVENTVWADMKAEDLTGVPSFGVEGGQ
jgi:hypothetical protein